MPTEGALLTTAQIWGWFQVFLRIAAVFGVAPVFGSREVPAQLRLLLALLLAFVMYPLVSAHVAPVPTDLYGIIAITLRETLVGLLIGMVVSLLFLAVQVAGELIDLQMGFSMAQVFNPSIGAPAAMIGQFLYRYTIVVFLLINGHHHLLQGIVDSFKTLPGSRLQAGADWMPLITDLAMTVMMVGMRLAAPALATLLIVDLALALVSRAVPQMNVFVVGMPLKIVVGLVIVVVALGLTTTVLQGYLGDIVPGMLRVLDTAGKG